MPCFAQDWLLGVTVLDVVSPFRFPAVAGLTTYNCFGAPDVSRYIYFLPLSYIHTTNLQAWSVDYCSSVSL